MFPATGSTIIAAIVFGWSSRYLVIAFEIIEGKYERLLHDASRHSERIGDREGRGAGSGFGQKSIAMPVIAPGEFHDQVAARRTASKSDS